MSSGNFGCECLNQTSVLSSLQGRDCITSVGDPGVLTIGGTCVPYDYGSNSCLQHDYLHDPGCQGDPSVAEIPSWCLQPWCYVDKASCKKNSDEEMFLSEYFALDDFFYSYSTCNSTNLFSLGFDPLSAVGGIGLKATVPTFRYPILNKQLPNGTYIYERSDDNTYYFNDSIPFGGLYIDYINSIVDLSNEDILNVTYTHTSRFSLSKYPSSSFTAAVQDVENGLVDLAVGPFWITGQRLQMTTFTVPLVYDKTVLVIPKPENKDGLYYETQKVLQPFTAELWAVLIFITIGAALLSVWFIDREMVARKHYGVRSFASRKKGFKEKKSVYFRLLLDNILQKSMFFFSAGIEQDVGASLPHKVLMFGFGFFILIAVSAYVANLAAFLTRSGLKSSDFKTIEEVVTNNVAICGHPALEEEIRLNWPSGRWLFPEDGFRGPNGMFEAYEKGECQFLAVGREDTVLNRDVQAKMCRLNLVYTESLITENPIAFPIRPQLASAFSYWMYTGEKTFGISLENSKNSFLEENEIKSECEVELSSLSKKVEVNKFAQVEVGNMFLPIMVFIICATIAVVLQVIHEKKRKKGRASSLFGRQSSLDIYDGFSTRDRASFYSHSSMKEDDDNWVMPRTKSIRWSDSDIPKDLEFGEVPDSNNADAIVDESVPVEVNSPLQSETQEQPLTRRVSTSISASETAAMSSDTSDEMEEKDEVDHRIDELVESGAIDEVLDFFDFFQEMKKLKKEK